MKTYSRKVQSVDRTIYFHNPQLTFKIFTSEKGKLTFVPPLSSPQVPQGEREIQIVKKDLHSTFKARLDGGKMENKEKLVDRVWICLIVMFVHRSITFSVDSHRCVNTAQAGIDRDKVNV